VTAKALGLIALLAAVATCKEEPARPEPSTSSDGGYAGAPGRNVIGDLPDGFYNDGPVADGGSPIGTRPIGGGGGGTGGRADGGGARADAARTSDRPATSGCSLLLQDCGDGKGCYPSSGSMATCRVGGSLIDHASCVDHEICAPGYLCVEALGAGGPRQCERICDPQATYACAGAGCMVYGTGPAGFCRP